MGRPSRYRQEFNEQAFKLCLLGATDKDLANFFEVDEKTVNNWKTAHPSFLQSLKDGKEGADARVAKSLFHRAIGYEHDDVKIFADPKSGAEKIVPFVKHYPPDTVAAIFWLKNRRPDLWRDKHQVEHAGPDGGPITVTEANEAKERLFERLAGIADRLMERLGPETIVSHGNGAVAGNGARQLPPGANGPGAVGP